MPKRKHRRVKKEEQVNPDNERRGHRDPLRPKSDKQADYIASIMTHDQTISMGCAGTGKTYIAATIAADLYRFGKVSKIVLTRPNVGASKSLGFFKGTIEEKIAPWVVPFTEVIENRLGGAVYEIAQKRGDIEVVPFEVMRGRTFKDCFVILDEAQNTTPPEMKMFLTRIGEDTKVVINGDIAQSDLKSGSGLKKIVHMVKSQMLPIPIIEFTEEDIVRSDTCAMWIKAFNKEGI